MLLGLLLMSAFARVSAQAPLRYTRWILAEGAANDFFDEAILIGNPNGAPARVSITLLPEGGAPIVVPTFTVLPTSRHTFTVNDHLPPHGGSVSAIVDSLDHLPLVVERTMTWPDGQRRGGHNAPGILAPAPIWYLAEGTTGFFDTFILVTNPDPSRDAQVEVTYLREISGPITQAIVVPKQGRTTIWVNAGLDLDRDGRADTTIGEPFSTIVRATNGVDIAVERAMYWNGFTGGHESAAVTSPHTTWLFAEGNTGGDATFSWETYLLLANPEDADANVTLTFFRQTGVPLIHRITVGAHRRKTVQVGTVDVNDDGVPDLSSASFATKVESTNAVPIVAERAMYWSSNGIPYIEGHDTSGVNAESTAWAFAEGAEGHIDASRLTYRSFFLVSNAGTSTLALKATFVREDGQGFVRTFDVPVQSRFTLPTGTYPELNHQRFSAFLESTNHVPFVAERAVYWGDGFSGGGHASVGTPWDAPIAAPPVIDLTPVMTSISPDTGLMTGGTDVTITGAHFIEPLSGADSATRVTFGTIESSSVTIVDETTLIATTPKSAQAGPVDVTVSNTHLNPAWPPTTVVKGFTYFATAPPPSRPMLQTELTLAFGDSITFGTTSTWCDIQGTPFVCSTVIPGYPERLREILRARYPAQGEIDVTNGGRPNECVARSGCTGVSGGRRLLDGIAGHDLVVILEGVNDANGAVPVGDVIAALRGMIAAVRAQNRQVILCALTPVKARENAPDDPPELWKTNPFRIAELNDAIEQLAIEDHVPRVNMFAAFGSDPGPLDCAASPACSGLLSPDGLHPNAAGYQRMADVIAAKISEQFEVR